MSEGGTKGWKEKKYVEVDRKEGTQEGERSWFC